MKVRRHQIPGRTGTPVKLTVTAPVRPTEDPAKVQQAVQAFWDGAVEGTPEQVMLTGGSLDAFRDRVWELQIIDTIRSGLLAGAKGRYLGFRLDKQAALRRKVSFPPSPHALGDLHVRVDLDEGDAWDDAEELVWWICPPTKDGKIVEPGQEEG